MKFFYIFASVIKGDLMGTKSPHFYCRLMSLKEEIAHTVEEKFAGTDFFLVDVKISPNKVIVFIDTASEEGIKLENCVEMSRFLQSKFEGTTVFETHELEVSSPGMDEPLKVKKQYQKRIGRNVTVLMKDGIRKDGVLKSVDDTGIEISGKKSVTESIAFDQIKETKIIFSINKILN